MNASEQFSLRLEELNVSQLEKIRDLYESGKGLDAIDSPELFSTFFNASFSNYLDKYHADNRPEGDQCSDKLFGAFIQYFTEQPSSVPERTYKSVANYFLDLSFKKDPAIPQDILDEFSEELREIVFKNIDIEDKSLMAIEREVEEYINSHDQDLRDELFKYVSAKYKHSIGEIQKLEEALGALNKEIIKVAGAHDTLSREEISLHESLRRLDETAPEEDINPTSLTREFIEVNKIFCNALLEETGLRQTREQGLSDVSNEDHFLTSRLGSLLDKAREISQDDYANLTKLNAIDFAKIKRDLLQVISERENGHDIITGVLKTKETEVRELEGTVRDKSSYVDKLKMDKRKLLREFDEMDESHHERYSALETQHTTQISQNQRLQRELAQIKQELLSVEDASAHEITQIKEDLAALRGKYGELVRKNNELEKNYKGLDTAFDTLDSQKTAVEKSLAWTRKEFSRLRETTTSRIREQEAVLHSKELVIDQLHERIRILSEKNELLQFQLDTQLASQQKPPPAEATVIIGRSLADELRELELEEALAEIKKEFAAYKADKQSELEALQKDLPGLKQQSSEQITLLELRLQEQQRELESVREKLEHADAEKVSLRAEVHLGSERITRLEERLHVQQRALESAREQLLQPDVEKERLREEVLQEKDAHAQKDAQVHNLMRQLQEVVIAKPVYLPV